MTACDLNKSFNFSTSIKVWELQTAKVTFKVTQSQWYVLVPVNMPHVVCSVAL